MRTDNSTEPSGVTGTLPAPFYFIKYLMMKQLTIAYQPLVTFFSTQCPLKHLSLHTLKHLLRQSESTRQSETPQLKKISKGEQSQNIDKVALSR